MDHKRTDSKRLGSESGDHELRTFPQIKLPFPRRFIYLWMACILGALALAVFFYTIRASATTLAYPRPVPASNDTQESFPPTANFANILTSTTVLSASVHMANVADRYHLKFDVYTDVGSGGNHFVHRAAMGNGVTIDDTYTGVVHSGATAIRNIFTRPSSTVWGGWYFQNGVLLPGATAPISNWGTYPNAGYNLTGATRLTFWARGAQGGERVEFFAFGINTGAYPDSEHKTTLCGHNTNYCFVTLSTSWQLYTITLSNLDLSYVIGGFGWVTNGVENSQPIEFYLDDIQYHLVHLEDPHVLTSYDVLPTSDPFDTMYRNVAFTYDNALALSAFVAMKDWTRAQQLANAFVYATQHDRTFSDHRVRNAYQSGDLANPPGWHPPGAARLPGWWNSIQGKWIEDPEQVGAGTGNTAWAILGLLNYYAARGGDAYLQAAIVLGNWIDANAYSASGGYTGGYNGPDVAPEQLTWKATEHNLDVYAAFMRLYALTGDPAWKERADHAKAFVQSMWNPAGGHFWTGTLTDGTTINKSIIPLDPQSWSALSLGSSITTTTALDYAEMNLTAVYTDSSDFVFNGFDFNNDRDNPWPEGTGQMIVAYWLTGQPDQARYYLDELREVQAKAQHGNGLGIVASTAYSTTTGLGWNYYNRIHIGATAWFIFAELRYNPFYGEFLNHVPVASTDYYTVTQGTPLVVASPGVLANDVDVDHDALVARLTDLPQHGQITLQPDGSFNYKPDTGSAGLDYFTYQAYDGELYSLPTLVTIDVLENTWFIYAPMVSR